MSYRPLIYDEKEMGRKIYEMGQIDDLNWPELLATAKYIRFLFSCGNAKLRTLLKDFLSKTPGFNYVRSSGYLGKIINSSNREFTQTKTVSITEFELMEIRKIKNFKWQKILLGFLFISKRNNNSGYVSLKDWVDVKTVSGISHVTTADVEDAVYYFSKSNLLKVNEYDKYYEAKHKILFSDIEDKNKIVFKVTNDKEARNLNKEYKEWCGGELSWCRECGNEFIKNNSNRHNYCDKCSGKRRLEKERVRSERNRKNKIRI